MSVKMKPTSVIKARLGINKGGRVQAFLTNTCYKHMDKYVPYDNGTLAYDSVDVQTDRIVYQAPYAHYLYEGKVMGPSIPIKENGVIVRWVSPKGEKKHYTGKDIDYSKSIAKGHTYAGPHWDKRMVSAEMQDVVKEVQSYINRGGK